MKFLHGNRIHCQKPSMIGISQAPLAIGSTKGDGNCFFRTNSNWLTRGPCLMITSFMMHNASKLSCLLDPHESMEECIQRTRTQSRNVWATEVEIFAAATMLHTAICVICTTRRNLQMVKALTSFKGDIQRQPSG